MTIGPTLRRQIDRLRRDVRGVAAIEFAIIGPLMLLVLAGTTDIGLVVFKRMQIDEAVSSAANAALIAGSGLSSSTVDAMAATVATTLTNAAGSRGAANRFQISFNGGRTYDFVGSAGTPSGQTSAADECRCPTQTNGAVSWGAKADCNTPCPNKSLAGKYVSIRFTRPYQPLFSQYGIVDNTGISIQTLALVQ